MARRTLPVFVVCLVAFIPAAGAEAPKAKAPATQSGDLYARLSAAYMNGDWAEVEKLLRAPAKELTALTAAQQADVSYVRAAMADCRPWWWTQCKAGQKVSIRPTVWEQPLNVTYAPYDKDGVELRIAGKDVGLSWNAANMDSNAPAEYGYLKGDLAGFGIWHSLGMTAALSAMPRLTVNPSEKDNLRINLYADFRGNVTGLYYTSPPARRWVLHICLAAYIPEFGKGPMAASRRAVASMFLTEVLSSPPKYPSLKLPDTLGAEAAEEKLAVFFKHNRTRRNAVWTIAEDKAFREAVKAFAAASGRDVLQTARVALPNGLTFALVAEEDGPFRAKRDAWVKAQFDKAHGK